MKIIGSICIVGLLMGFGLGAATCGCASIGKFTPQGAVVASGAVTVAQGLLKGLDGFYGNLVDLKAVPDFQVQATRALTMADAAAAKLRQVIAGATVTDEQLNLVAGQVDGARAILNGTNKAK